MGNQYAATGAVRIPGRQESLEDRKVKACKRIESGTNVMMQNMVSSRNE